MTSVSRDDRISSVHYNDDGQDGYLTFVSGDTMAFSYKTICNATAYSTKGYTASGYRTEMGNIAVDPSVFPYGTRFFIQTTNGSWVYAWPSRATAARASRATRSTSGSMSTAPPAAGGAVTARSMFSAEKTGICTPRGDPSGSPLGFFVGAAGFRISGVAFGGAYFLPTAAKSMQKRRQRQDTRFDRQSHFRPTYSPVYPSRGREHPPRPR